MSTDNETGETEAGETVRRALTRADFDLIEKSAKDLPREFVPVPEWGKALGFKRPSDAVVCIRTLTGTERDSYEGSLITQRGNNRQMNMHNARAKLVAMCLIDETSGERIFSDREIGLLGQRSASALDRVFDACRELSGLTTKNVEELTEELGKDQNG